MISRLVLLFALLSPLLRAQDLAPLYTLYKNGMGAPLLARTERLLKDNPDHAELNQLHGRALVDSGSIREAIPFLEKAIAKDTNHGWITAWSMLYLAQARFLTDDYEGSRKILRDCIALRATENVTNTAQRFQFAIGQADYFSSWTHVETEHFRFHLQVKLPPEALKQYTEAREKSFVSTLAALGGGKLPKKIDFIVWANRFEPMEKFRMNLGLADPQKSVVYCAMDNSVGHEMTHVITHHLTPAARLNKVGLINEGVAVHFDQNPRDDLQAARAFIERRMLNKVSLEDVWKNWNKYPDELSYPLAGAFVKELLTKYGTEKFRRLLLDQSLENARVIYGPQLDAFIHDFEQRLTAKQI